MKQRQLKALDLAFCGIGLLLMLAYLILAEDMGTSLFIIGILFMFLSFSITDYRIVRRKEK